MKISAAIGGGGGATSKFLGYGAGKLGAFGEQLVAVPTNQVYVAFPYGIETDLIVTSGAGAVTQASGMALVATTAGANDKFVLQTDRSLRYIPSQGGDCKVTPFFASGTTQLKQLAGVGDDDDGFFVGMSGATLGIYHRQFGNETFIPQSSWNINPLDGSGGETPINPYLGNVFQIQFQWLGVGAITFLAEHPDEGILVPVHRINYATRNSVPSVENPSNRIRYEMDNNGSGVAATGKIACLMGRTEGGEALAKSFAASGSAAVSTAVTTFGTIKNNETFLTKQNHRVAQLRTLNVYIEGNVEVFAELYKNITLDGSESFSPVSSGTSIMYDDDTGAPFAVDPIGSGLLAGALCDRNNLTQIDLRDLDIELHPGDTFTMVLRRTKSVNYTASSFLGWVEYY